MSSTPDQTRGEPGARARQRGTPWTGILRSIQVRCGAHERRGQIRREQVCTLPPEYRTRYARLRIACPATRSGTCARTALRLHADSDEATCGVAERNCRPLPPSGKRSAAGSPTRPVNRGRRCEIPRAGELHIRPPAADRGAEDDSGASMMEAPHKLLTELGAAASCKIERILLAISRG